MILTLWLVKVCYLSNGCRTVPCRPVARFWGLEGQNTFWGARCLFLLYLLNKFFWKQANLGRYCPRMAPCGYGPDAMYPKNNIPEQKSRAALKAIFHLVLLPRCGNNFNPFENQTWKSFFKTQLLPTLPVFNYKCFVLSYCTASSHAWLSVFLDFGRVWSWDPACKSNLLKRKHETVMKSDERNDFMWKTKSSRMFISKYYFATWEFCISRLDRWEYCNGKIARSSTIFAIVRSILAKTISLCTACVLTDGSVGSFVADLFCSSTKPMPNISIRCIPASRHHKGCAAECDRKLFCWEIDFVPVTHLQSSIL